MKAIEATREHWQGPPWKLTGLRAKMDFTTAPVFIILFGDPRTNAGLPMNIRYTPHKRELIYTASLANAFMYMHLAATTLGLASQWVSVVQTPFLHCMIKDLLGIPFELTIFDMIALGYPAIKPRPKFMRDSKKMIHYNDCVKEDFRSDEEVREFVKRARNWNIGSHRRNTD